MAISFNSTLADSDLDCFDGHSGLRVSRRETAQAEAVIGADHIFYRGRGNSLVTVSFSSRKRHDTIAAAVAYCGSHVLATKGDGTFSGFGVSLTHATCNATVEHEGGVVTRATYEITGTAAA